MTPQYILKKSLCRKAACFSAHVKGKGYINNGEVARTRADYDRQRWQSAMSEIDNLLYACQYAEPGYVQPRKGVLMANWNVFSTDVTDLLEKYGYSIEWSDEWATCDGCCKAVRTSPDSYSWVASFGIEEGTLLCHECIKENPADYLESLEDRPDAVLTLDIDPIEHGYTLVEGDFEAGLHPGQIDNPKAIYERLRAAGHHGLLFKIDAQCQFDVTFSVYRRQYE